MDPFYQSTQESLELFYPGEMMQSITCPREENTGLEYDPRFYESGLNTNDYDVQDDNGVLNILLNAPMIWTLAPQANKVYNTVKSYNRPTIPWSLECESDGRTRSDGYEALQL